MTNKSVMKKKNKVWRAISISVLVLSLFLLSYTLIMKAFNRTPRLFGYSFHIVVTGSMEPDIRTNDLIIAKKIDTKEIAAGDYIVFNSPDPALKNRVIVHRVEKIDETANGLKFTTKGIANPAQDPYAVPESNVIGIYKRSSVVLSVVTRTAMHIFILAINHLHITFMIIMLIIISTIAALVVRTYKIYKQEKAQSQSTDETENNTKDNTDN